MFAGLRSWFRVRRDAIIEEAAEVRAIYVPVAEAEATPGLIRGLSVAPPPTPDGRLRVIEIVGVDRQACGGTHLANTGQSLPVRITKVENKGRRNRRVRLALHDPAEKQLMAATRRSPANQARDLLGLVGDLVADKIAPRGQRGQLLSGGQARNGGHNWQRSPCRPSNQQRVPACHPAAP
jgi:alanyl-tRNA synthetase